MPRKTRPSDTDSFGGDSFLDVVANVVGILIILVMVVGMRVKNIPADVGPPQPELDLTEPRRLAISLEGELRRLTDESQAVALQAASQSEEQQRLSAAIAREESALAAAGQRLDARAQHGLEIQQAVFAAQSQIERLQKELSVASVDKPAIRIESYPTPISRTVEGKEGHFQLRGQRIAYIPLDELIDQLKSDAPRQVWKLRNLPEATATVGPIGGFRMRYTFERVEVPIEDQLASKRFGSIVHLSNWTLVPSQAQLGETLEEALAEQSNFRAAMARLNPRVATITLWVYPDSFAEFRRLKKELYHLGFAIAGRPLPEGTPIGGSPHGSKSAAQ
jgi:hypothetical protein